MKFIFNGSYTTYDGHEFLFGKPTEVTGAGTIERLLKDERFRQADEPTSLRLTEHMQYWGASRQEIVFDTKVAPPPSYCEKCGRTFPKGYVMHKKNCKGIK